jgi:hypothetical protein
MGAFLDKDAELAAGWQIGLVSQIEREFKWNLIGNIRCQIPPPSDRL